MNDKDKMFRELTDSEYNELTMEERLLFATRPKSEVSSVRSWMMIRTSLLVVMTIYYTYRYGDYGETNVLLLILFCYEVAYYFLRKEKAKRDYTDALSRYFEKVEEAGQNSLSKK